MSEVFFTADTHFGHKNVISYCKRPFANTDEMDEALINNWNEDVKPEDTIWHLGDFAFAPQVRIKEILSRLNGNKVLIMGNHDKKTVTWWLNAGFQKVLKPAYGETVKYGNEGETVLFHMSHYPHREVMCDYDDRDYLTPRAVSRDDIDVPLVHGHVHESWRLRTNLVNVGCDVWDYKPVRLSQVRACVRLVHGSHIDTGRRST